MVKTTRIESTHKGLKIQSPSLDKQFCLTHEGDSRERWSREVKNSSFSNEEKRFLKKLYLTYDYEKSIVRIAYGGGQGLQVNANNLIYFESKVKVKEPRQEVKDAYSGSTLNHPDGIEVVQFPRIERLKRTFEEYEIGGGGPSSIANKDERARIARELQVSIEKHKRIYRKLKQTSEQIKNLRPEWSPESSDEKRNLRYQAAKKKEAYEHAWYSTFKLRYDNFWVARLEHNDLNLRKKSRRNFVGLSIIDTWSDEETYCEYCGVPSTLDTFVKIPVRHKDGVSYRVCGVCASSNPEFEQEDIDESLDNTNTTFYKVYNYMEGLPSYT